MKSTLLRSLACGAALACAALPPLCARADDDAGAADASVKVQTTPVRSGKLARTVIAYGVAQPGPASRRQVMAPVAATVAAVYAHVGETVARGAPLLELAPTPTTAANYAAAVSAARVAHDALLRTRELRAQQLATEPQVAAAEKADSDSRAALHALDAQGAGGPRVLHAADGGVVTMVSAVAGAIVAEGSPLIELARPSGLVLVAGLTPADARLVKAGDAAKVVPIGGSGAIGARVSLAGAAVDPASGLVPVEISLPRTGLLPGESAEARIATAEVAGFLVPHAAVLVNDHGETYLVQVEHGLAKSVPVQVRVAGGAEDIVAGALDRGAPIVLAGAYQLQDGMKVRYGGAADKAAQ
ncbi:MAG: HlyD family efflux transporter periplasmic adaptor subunit [Gammaproteobacteria bacterium]|nr:HlyD family efflux transporter periplasmic adaptor subunit [Gammaproteobacteria bacterium]